jgi:ketosteroid isomerase-like protein
MRLGEIGDNFSVNVNQFVADGDTVVTLGTYTWDRKDSGEPAEVKMAHVWTLDDGKLSRSTARRHRQRALSADLIASFVTRIFKE